MRPQTSSAILLLAACGSAHAASVVTVDIRGLDAAMTDNVRLSLSLVDAIGKNVSDRRLAYMIREAESETRAALEPFGYYTPQIEVHRSPAGEQLAADANIAVSITIAPGTPVLVRSSHVAINGAGNGDRYLQQELAAFEPAPGAVFNHGVYEAGKARISRRLAERGYFDADFASRTVEVTRAANAADIDLVWTSGDRYAMGPVAFTQTPEHIIRDALLGKLVYWDEGSYYHQGKLDRLRKSLVALDYFSRIEIDPQPDKAIDHRVPVQVTLTPAKRSIYTAGVSYGTDSGGGVRLGVERRYLNSRGHKALAEIDGEPASGGRADRLHRYAACGIRRQPQWRDQPSLDRDRVAACAARALGLSRPRTGAGHGNRAAVPVRYVHLSLAARRIRRCR
jgi:translocation and assembly module TamA